MRIGPAKVAQILAFPALRAIPAPELPLKGVAYDKYTELANNLLNARKLNNYTRMICEQIAVLHAQNYQRVEHGLLPSRTAVDQIAKLYKELRLVDESDHTAPPEGPTQNRFSRFGVITRRGAEKAKV